MTIQEIPIAKLKGNPKNPRVLRDEKFICPCGKEFTSRKACKSRTPKYCSKACYAESLRKHRPPKVKKARVYGPLTNDHRAKISAARKASDKCHGAALWNWKGGDATKRVRERQYNRNRWQRIRAGGELPLPYLSAVMRAQRGLCFYCDRPLEEGRKTHIEHLTPITRGGTNEWHNLVYSCQPCNNSKRTKTLLEFAIHRMQPHLLDKSILIQCAAQRAVQRLTRNHAVATN